MSDLRKFGFNIGQKVCFKNDLGQREVGEVDGFGDGGRVLFVEVNANRTVIVSHTNPWLGAV